MNIKELYDIVSEKSLKETIEDYAKFYIKEYIQVDFAFDKQEFSVKDAFKEFISSNKSNSTEPVKLNTIQMFIKNVFKGGKHSISVNEFIKFAKTRGLEIIK